MLIGPKGTLSTAVQNSCNASPRRSLARRKQKKHERLRPSRFTTTTRKTAQLSALPTLEWLSRRFATSHTMEQLSSSSMLLYALSIATVVFLNYPGLWRPIFGQVTSLFFPKSATPKRLDARDTSRVPSIGETIDSCDPTVDSLVETSEETDHRVVMEDAEQSAALPKHSLSPEPRKNVRFGSLSSIEEKTIESAKDSRDDPLKCSTHSTRSNSSRVSFAAAAEVVPTAARCPQVAMPAFSLDSIKAPSIPARRQESSSIKSSQSSLSSSSSEHVPCIPWMDDPATGASVSSTREESITSDGKSEGPTPSTTSSAQGGAGGSTHSNLSNRLRNRLSHGPKQLAAVRRQGHRHQSLSIMSSLDTDSMRSSLSSEIHSMTHLGI